MGSKACSASGKRGKQEGNNSDSKGTAKKTVAPSAPIKEPSNDKNRKEEQIETISTTEECGLEKAMKTLE